MLGVNWRETMYHRKRFLAAHVGKGLQEEAILLDMVSSDEAEYVCKY